MPSRPERPEGISTRGFFATLAVVLVVSFAARSAFIDADAPTDVGRDFALSTDGSWYSAAALDRAIGRDCDVTPAYDRGPFTAYARLVYAIFGPGLASTNWLSVPPSMLAILFCALAARALAGNAAGLLAGALLSFNYSFLVFNRNAVIYTFLAMIAAAVVLFMIVANRDRRVWAAIAAWVTTLAGIVLVKEILVCLLPLLLFTWPIPDLLRRRPAFSAILGLTVAAVCVGAGFALGIGEKFGQKLNDYFGSAGLGDLAQRALAFESRSDLFRSMPVVATCALLTGARRRLNLNESALLVTLMATLLLFAPFRYSPLRYLLPLFPAFAVLAAATISRILLSDRESTPAAPTKWTRALRSLVLAWLAGSVALSLLPDAPMAALGLWVAFLAVIGAALWTRWTPRWPEPLCGRRLATALLAIAFGTELFRCAPTYAEPRYTTKEAQVDAAAVLETDACLAGLFSHILTTENEIGRSLVSASRFGNGRLRKTFERRGVTHMTFVGGDGLGEILARFRVDGAELHHVHTFHIRGLRILLFRFDYAKETYELSDYERGVEALSGERYDEAAAAFEAAAARTPASAAPLSALAVAELRRGRPEAARLRAQEAIAKSPWDVRALGVEAEILLRSGDVDAARERFERMHRLDPTNPLVEKMLRQLRS